MKTQLKQNVRLALAGIALLFVATVASVKADMTTPKPNTPQKTAFGPAPCFPGIPCPPAYAAK